MDRNKLFLIILLFILIIPSISAIRINEVELNPAGTDSGNEWIELYSKEEINLKDYKLVNNDGGEINLEENFSGYYVYVFSTQWLDNTDEKVFLYKNDELIDETDLFADDKNDGRAWSYCSSSGWQFIESTKEEENGCEKDVSEEEVEDIEKVSEGVNKNQTQQQEQIVEPVIEKAPQTITAEVIKLNPKVIKSEGNNEEREKSDYAIYGFLIFSILLVILITIRWKKRRTLE